jgi:hypothetical protein
MGDFLFIAVIMNDSWRIRSSLPEISHAQLVSFCAESPDFLSLINHSQGAIDYLKNKFFIA